MFKTQTVTTRTIYVAECKGCGQRWEEVKDPPRERRCNECNEWCQFEAVEYTGKDRFDS